MKKIRLLTISATCEIGGSVINMLRLLKCLNKNEYEVLHLIPYPGPLADEFEKAGIRVKVVDMPRIRFFKNPLRHIINLLKFIPTVFKIKNIIRDCQIDIVCSSSMVNPYGALAAKLANKPYILMAVEYLSALKPIIPYFYFLSDRIICCSNMVKSMFKISDKVSTLYPGLDLDEYTLDINGKAVREELGFSGNLVSLVTRLAAWKGVEVFIKAAGYIKGNVKFVIFGQPVMGKEQYLVKLKMMIETLGLQDKVIINTEYKHKDIPEVIAASDILVHASLRPEPFGLTVIEAMAMGKPVVASKSGGPAEVITDGEDGILVEQGKSEVLAAAVSRLLDNLKLAREMGRKARKKVVKKFDIKDYAGNFDRTFKTVLKEHNQLLEK